MAKYVEQNLGKNESIVKEAKLTPVYLVGKWVVAILFCWLLLIPVFKAIWATIEYCRTELALTNKRVVGRFGVFSTESLDAPLNKVQNIAIDQGLWGKIFNYGTITITTAAGALMFHGISHADAFKGMVMAQIDQYEEDRVKQQADEMANAMAGVLNK